MKNACGGIVWVSLVVVATGFPTGAAAQSTREPPDPADPSASAPGLSIYVGMWTSHLRDLGRGFENNWLVAVGWRGYYGGTFVNSYGDRSFTAGIYRPLARGAGDRITPGIGFRLGIVTGYDDRFLPVAAKAPVLPVAQLVGDVEVGRTGLELAWSGLVASFVPRLRF